MIRYEVVYRRMAGGALQGSPHRTGGHGSETAWTLQGARAQRCLAPNRCQAPALSHSVVERAVDLGDLLGLARLVRVLVESDPGSPPNVNSSVPKSVTEPPSWPISSSAWSSASRS